MANTTANMLSNDARTTRVTKTSEGSEKAKENEAVLTRELKKVLKNEFFFCVVVVQGNQTVGPLFAYEKEARRWATRFLLGRFEIKKHYAS